MIGVLLLGPRVLASGPDARQLFLQQYEPHSSPLISRYGMGQARYQVRSPLGKDEELLSTITGKYNLDNYRFDVETKLLALPGKEVKSVRKSSEVRNTRYHFMAAEQEPGKYIVTDLQLYSDPNESEPWCLFCFPCADRWLQKTYIDIARDPSTKVLSTQETRWRDRKVIEVIFEYSYYHGEEKKTKRGRSAYYFDPSVKWVCVGDRSITQDTTRSIYHESVYVYDTSNEWPVPIREELWELDERRPDAKTLLRATDIEDFQSLPKLDESEFRLTAFGLPEPVGITWEEPTPRYIWFLIATGVLGALGIVFRILARRRSAAKAPV